MKQRPILLTVLLAALSSFSAEYYVDASRPNDSGVATDWATAKRTIQAAVDLAVDGDTVWVAAGTYSEGAYQDFRVYITNAVAVQSYDGAEVTFIQGDAGELDYNSSGHYINWHRGAYLGSGAVLDGFTITGARSEGGRGGGVHINGGTLNNCIVTDNISWRYGDDGGGVYCEGGGTLNDCVVTSNSTVFHNGGGVYLNGGTMNRCLISQNSVNGSGEGSGVALGPGSSMNNCTMIGNKAYLWSGSASGVYFFGGGTMYNCTVGGNRNEPYGPEMNIGGFLTITTVAGANGSISPANPAVGIGQGQTFQINPAVGYAVASLKVDGNAVPVASAYTFNNVSSMHTIAATFAKTYTLTVNHGAGGGSYTNGQQVVIVPDLVSNDIWPPAETWDFCAWVGDTQYLANATSASTTVTMPTQAVILIATYTCREAAFNFWMNQHGLTNYITDVAADRDGDGLKAWQEYIAGTDPTNPASRFCVTETPRNVLSWSGVSGRVYSVYWATNLMNGFQCLESNIPWTRGRFTNSVYDANGQGFYKIDVKLAP